MEQKYKKGCSKCSDQPASEARFCAYCGNPLIDSEVLFQSIFDSHHISSLDPEKAMQLKAKDLMSKSMVTVCEEDSVVQAALLMMRYRVSGLPVVSRNHRLVGVITATDLFHIMGKAQLQGEKQPAFPDVQEVMTRDVQTISPETPFSEMIQLMCIGNIHTLPVIENDNLVGVIGRRDVIFFYYQTIPKQP
ncbi:MAG TPA: CBS domain-containing protein [Candidatus Omnitrophota bacterium]|nr:CBS domain-containing protein [Candidatus Omnitrophota bacterium]